MSYERIVLPVRGMLCTSTESRTVERELLRVPGVVSAYVNPVTEKAYIAFDADRCTLAELTAAIEGLGFKVGAAS